MNTLLQITSLILAFNSLHPLVALAAPIRTSLHLFSNSLLSDDLAAGFTLQPVPSLSQPSTSLSQSNVNTQPQFDPLGSFWTIDPSTGQFVPFTTTQNVFVPSGGINAGAIDPVTGMPLIDPMTGLPSPSQPLPLQPSSTSPPILVPFTPLQPPTSTSRLPITPQPTLKSSAVNPSSSLTTGTALAVILLSVLSGILILALLIILMVWIRSRMHGGQKQVKSVELAKPATGAGGGAANCVRWSSKPLAQESRDDYPDSDFSFDRKAVHAMMNLPPIHANTNPLNPNQEGNTDAYSYSESIADSLILPRLPGHSTHSRAQPLPNLHATQIHHLTGITTAPLNASLISQTLQQQKSTYMSSRHVSLDDNGEGIMDERELSPILRRNQEGGDGDDDMLEEEVKDGEEKKDSLGLVVNPIHTSRCV